MGLQAENSVAIHITSHAQNSAFAKLLFTFQPMFSLPCIWVIDDDAIYQFAVKFTLQKLGFAHEVQAFSNGDLAKEALSDSTQTLPDLILLDINMPIMDGWEFLDWYSQFQANLPRSIPIFMVSSSIDPNDIAKAKSYTQVLNYISKPLTEGSFFQIFSELNP